MPLPIDGERDSGSVAVRAFGFRAAVLQELEDTEGTRLRREIVEAASDAAGRLGALLPVFARWFGPGDFRGSLLIAAAAHLSDVGRPAREVAAAHFAAMHGWLTELASEAGAPRPEQLARALRLLAQGAVADAWVRGDLEAITAAVEAGGITMKSSAYGQTPSRRWHGTALQPAPCRQRLACDWSPRCGSEDSRDRLQADPRCGQVWGGDVQGLHVGWLVVARTTSVVARR